MEKLFKRCTPVNRAGKYTIRSSDQEYKMMTNNYDKKCVTCMTKTRQLLKM